MQSCYKPVGYYDTIFFFSIPAWFKVKDKISKLFALFIYSFTVMQIAEKESIGAENSPCKWRQQKSPNSEGWSSCKREHFRWQCPSSKTWQGTRSTQTQETKSTEKGIKNLQMSMWASVCLYVERFFFKHV